MHTAIASRMFVRAVGQWAEFRWKYQFNYTTGCGSLSPNLFGSENT